MCLCIKADPGFHPSYAARGIQQPVSPLDNTHLREIKTAPADARTFGREPRIGNTMTYRSLLVLPIRTHCAAHAPRLRFGWRKTSTAISSASRPPGWWSSLPRHEAAASFTDFVSARMGHDPRPGGAAAKRFGDDCRAAGLEVVRPSPTKEKAASTHPTRALQATSRPDAGRRARPRHAAAQAMVEQSCSTAHGDR